MVGHPPTEHRVVMGFVSEPITPDPLLIDLPRRPVLTFWVVAVALEVLLGVAFLATGADAAIEEGLAQAGLDFSSDLLTAVRVVVVYPAALLGVTLALAQVAAPDLAVLVVARIRGGRTLLNAVGSRFRPWSKEVGAGRGIRIWLTVVVVFSACNIASGLLHGAFVAGDFTWHLSWGMLALLPVAMFLDAGALLEENGWRGFALPVLLRTHGPVAASLIVGLAWASWHFPVKFDAFLDYGVWGSSGLPRCLHDQDRGHLRGDHVLLGTSGTSHAVGRRHARALQRRRASGGSGRRDHLAVIRDQ